MVVLVVEAKEFRTISCSVEKGNSHPKSLQSPEFPQHPLD